MREMRAELKPNGKRMWGFAAIAAELNAEGIVAKGGGQGHPFAVQQVLKTAGR